MLLSEINSFFQSHPLKEQFFSVNESERSGMALVAERDVMAAIGNRQIASAQEREFLNAAIAEQTIFLILNPEYLTGTFSHTQSVGSAGENRRFTSSSSPLGQRAAALIAPILARTENSGIAADDPDVPAADPGSADDNGLPPVIRLNRG